MQQVNLGIIGSGTVGGGVFDALQRNGEDYCHRASASAFKLKKLPSIRSKKPAASKFRNIYLRKTGARLLIIQKFKSSVAELCRWNNCRARNCSCRAKDWKAGRHGEQGAAFCTWRGTFCRGEKNRRESLLRSQRLRRHSHHQVATRRVCRQSHQRALRHCERHLQLHSHAHEARRRGLC